MTRVTVPELKKYYLIQSNSFSSCLIGLWTSDCLFMLIATVKFPEF